MAKLAARGRTELAMVAFEQTSTNPTSNLIWSRRTRVFMSDRKILEKCDYRTRPDPTFSPEGRVEYGHWSVRGAMKPNATINQILEVYIRAGWKVVGRNDG